VRDGGEEVNWLARERRGANEVAVFAVWDWDAGGREGCDCHAEAGTLDLAGVDGEEGTGSAKEGDDVCSSCDGAEV